MSCDPLATACQLQRLNDTLAQVNWASEIAVPLLSIAASVFLGVAALRSSRVANRLAEEAREFARRDERRRYGVALQAYFDSRQEDVRTGRNFNQPHYTHAVEAIAQEINEPNSSELLNWLTDAIDRALASDADRGVHHYWLSTSVPQTIAAWVHSPETFSPARFQLYGETQSTRQP